MEILFASIPIADDTLLKPGSGWDLPLQQLVDQVALPGAAAEQVFARGNRVCTVSGTVWRLCSTHAEAVLLWATHAGTLPASGTLSFGVSGVTVASAPAVLQSCLAHRPTGVSVQIDYAFICPPPTAS